jgi:hypothetical protein
MMTAAMSTRIGGEAGGWAGRPRGQFGAKRFRGAGVCCCLGLELAQAMQQYDFRNFALLAPRKHSVTGT